MSRIFYCDPCGEDKGWPRQISPVKGRCQVCGEEAVGSQVALSILPKEAEVKGQLRFKFKGA